MPKIRLWTYIKIVRYSDNWEQPKDAIKPSNIAVKPAWVVMHERL